MTLNVFDKREIAGEIRNLVQVFADLVADERVSEESNPVSDNIWNLIVDKLNLLSGD